MAKPAHTIPRILAEKLRGAPVWWVQVYAFQFSNFQFLIGLVMESSQLDTIFC